MTEASPPAAQALSRGARRRGDQVFQTLSGGAGLTVLVLITAIAVFLISQAVPSLRADSSSFLGSREFLPESSPPAFGVAALAFGTVVSSLLALVMAVPVAIGVALLITQVAPRRLAGLLGHLVDLLAAVPSVVYGLWGVAFLNARIVPISRALHGALGWIPLFGDTGGRYGRSMFLAAVVLAIMILPIIAALSREIFLQVPAGNREAAYALGATRWEMIRLAVLPFSRPGVTAAVMLGLGRALGETIAVALVLLSNFDITAKVLGPGGNTIAANIATKFGEYGPTGRGALIASGLVLFVITFVVNLLARGVVLRSARSRAAA